MKRIVTALFIIAIVAGVIIYDKFDGIKRYFNPPAESAESSEVVIGDNISDNATLVRVKDGDTYVIKLDSTGREVTVRLIGVDTPESVAPEDYYKDNTKEGKMVSDIVKEKLKEGDRLSVEYDVQTEDKYGRTLAYLYFSDGTMVQDWLLQNGYAQTMTIQPNSKYAEHFAEIQHRAAENGAGIWGEGELINEE